MFEISTEAYSRALYARESLLYAVVATVTPNTTTRAFTMNIFYRINPRHHLFYHSIAWIWFVTGKTTLNFCSKYHLMKQGLRRSILFKFLMPNHTVAVSFHYPPIVQLLQAICRKPRPVAQPPFGELQAT